MVQAMVLSIRKWLLCAGLISVYILLPISVAAQNWAVKPSINTSYNFNGVYFTSDQTGYAVGTSGVIYKTTDGGLTWSAQTSNTTETLTDVFFVNTNTGFVIGANGTIRKTTNGGMTWSTQTATGTSTTLFNQVYFLTANNGYIVGSGGKIIKTTDGGTNWSTVVSGTTNNLMGAHFINVNVGFVAGASGLIRKTTDGGANWSTLTIGTTSNLNDIQFLDASNGFVAGNDGQIWKTTDGGTTWTDKGGGFSLDYNKVYFTDANNGYLASVSGYTRITTDGGNNWITYIVGNSTFNGIHFSSAFTGYMVGPSGLFTKYQSELEPEYQGSDLVFEDVFSTSMHVGFTASPDIPSGYLAIRKTGSAPSTDPVDGITYGLGQTLGDGTVVYIGASTGFSESSLSPGTTYYYKIYAYNGSATAINYKVDVPLSGSKTTYLTGQPWTDITIPGFYYPQDVHFFDANHGGIAGGYFLETTANGGTNWTDGFQGNSDGYSGIFFVSETIGYTVGTGMGPTRLIRRTVNGGQTWVDQVRAVTTYALNDVWFTSPTVGFAVGSNGNILKTSSGTTWSPVASATTNTLYAVHFPTSTTGFAVGESGTIIQTSVSGSSWTPCIAVGTTNTLNDVYFVSASTGYVVGNAGTILKTVNGGSSWSAQNSGTTLNLNGVHFIDENTGYVVGMSGKILKTTNGGAEWYDFPSGTVSDNDLYGVYFPTPDVGYAVGQKTLRFQSVPEPSSQPSALAFGTIQPHTVNISFSPPGEVPSGYLILRKAGSAPAASSFPLDGVSYAVGNTIGDATVAYVGTNPVFEDIGLTISTNYYYKVFAYNVGSGSGSLNYDITGPLSGDFYTLATKPGSQPSALVFDNVTSSTLTLSFAAAAGTPDGYFVLRKAGSAPSSAPIDGVNYTAGQTLGDSQIAYIGAATGFTDTGLTPGQNYFYKIFSVNGSGLSTNYLTTAPLSGNIDFGIPTIASFAPASGAIGATVTITGTNFSSTLGNNTVYFGATRASVSSATTTQLVVAVPAGASYQPISVTIATSGLTASSKKPFVVTFPSSGVGIDASSFTTDNIDFGTEDTPNSLAAHDLDGDGKPDLVVTATGNNTVSVYRNTGTLGAPASFASPRLDLTTSSSFPFGVSIGDLDGDGKADLVVTNVSGSSVSVFRNTSTLGTISFAPKLDYTTGSGPSAIVIGDLNQDGRPEMAIPNYNSNTVSVFRNLSTPGVISFSAKSDFTVVNSPNSVAMGDIDGDGKNDLAVTGNTSGAVSVLRNTTTSSISFATKVDFTTGTNPEAVALADLDGDTKLDMAVANGVSSTLSVFRNTATSGVINSGSFAAKADLATGTAPSTIAVADLDGDGKPDVATSNAHVLSNTISLFRNTSTSGTISLTAKVDVETGTMPNGFAIADFDGNGKPDLAATSENSGRFLIHRNLIAGPVISSISPSAGALGTEVAIYGSGFSSTPATNVVYFGATRATVTGASPTTLTVTVPAGTTYQPITTTLNGLTAYSPTPFNVTFTSSLSLDANSFAAPTDFTTGNTPYGLAIGDLDGDGKSDMAVANSGDNNVSIFRNTSTVGTLSYAARVNFATGTAPYAVAIDDVDGDGKKDVIVSNYNSNSISIFRNTSTSGSISLVAKVDLTTASSPISIATSDLDGDGRTDIIVACALSNKVSVFRNIGSQGNITVASFAAKVDYTTGSVPMGVAVGDLNGDLKPDLAVTNSSANTVSVLKNTSVTGVLNFDAKVDFSTGATSQPNHVAIGDLTNDGKPDLAVANNNNAKVALFKSTTTGGSISFAVRVEASANTGPGYAAIGDLDGDGYPDVATANLTSTSSSLMRNTTSSGAISFASTYNLGGLGFQPRAIALGDMDGDGKTDINITTAASNRVSTIRNSNALSSPTANSATTITQSGFVANWSSIAAAADYRLDVSADNFATLLAGYSNLVVAGTSQTVTGLNPGTTYKYRVRASNASGVSANTPSISVLTLPATPVANAGTSISQTGFTANWSAAAGATSYRLDVALATDFNAFSLLPAYSNLDVTGTSVSVTGLTAGTSYYYRVRATNATGASGNSGTVTVLTISPAPVALAASGVSTTGFTANWSTATNASSYLLDVSTDNFSTFLLGYNGVVLSGTTNVLSGLTPGTSYQYRVRASNVSGVSGNSSTVQVATLALPPVAQNGTSISSTGFTANWLPSTGATEYRIDVSQTNSFDSYVGSYFNQQAGTGTSFAVSGLNAGTHYYYRVRAANASGSSISSSTITALTLPAAPVANASTSIASTEFVASWSAVASATGYFIDVSTAADNFTSYVAGYEDTSVSGTSVTVQVPVAGVEYRYRVRSINPTGASENSNVVTTLVKPDAPVTASASAIAAQGFTANWSAVPGALGYYLDVSLNNFSSFLPGYENFLLSGVSKDISGLTAGTGYQYRVRAYNATGSSLSSIVESTITIPPAPVTISSSAFTPTSFTANWEPATGAESYRLDVSSDPDFASGTLVTNYADLVVDGTSSNVTGLTPGTVYYYRVRAVNASGTSINSNVTSSTNIPGAPNVAGASSITASGFVINWSTTPGADSYFLDLSTNNFITFVGVFNNFSVSGNSYPVSGLNAGTEYQYRLRAANSSGTSVNSLSSSVITLPQAPTTTAPSVVTTSGFVANWTVVASATSYRLDVSKDDFATFATGFNNLVVTGTSAAVTGLLPGTTYHYRVKAVNASGESALSESQLALTVPAAPQPLAASDVDVHSFSANWSASIGATSYYIDVSKDNFASFVSGFNNKSLGSALTTGVNALAPATTYQYRLRSANDSGTSPNSAAISMTTLDTEPSTQATEPAFTEVTESSLVLSYLPGTNVTGYLVVRHLGDVAVQEPVDGATYVEGATLGDGLIIYVGSSPTLQEANLQAGTVYTYTIYAYHGEGVATNYLQVAPLQVDQITLSASPVATSPSAVSQHSFLANWESAKGASAYYLDVSTDSFETFVDGFENLLISEGLSYEVSGLAGGVLYQYRVRATNAAGNSANSDIEEVLTIPETPAGLTASSISSTSFKLTWNELAGADHFLVDLSPDNFVTFTLNNISIPGPTSFEFLGLSPLTVYKVRLRSNNATGDSPNSEVITVTTQPAGGTAVLKVETPVFASKMYTSPVSVSVEVTGGVDPKVVKLKHRNISATAYETVTLSLRNGSTTIYDFSATPEMADELGVEFFIEASDATGTVKESSIHYFIYKAVQAASNQSIPFVMGAFDGKAASYQMFSVPYLLDDSNISNLFDPALNGQDPTRWKLLHYQNGAYAIYPEQLKKIELGKGYWFNTIEPDFAIKLTQATVGQVSQSSNFQMTLERGWNQIGNPYPFNIDWEEVKATNPDAGLNAAWLFEEGNYLKKDVLATWKGAFVFSDNGGTISIPLSAKTNATGRELSEEFGTLDEPNWQVPVLFEVNGMKARSGVGMNSQASMSKDKWDEITVPRFLEYAEMKTLHPEFFAPEFSMDVVKTVDAHSWTFELESSQSGDAMLQWNQDILQGQQAGLFLIDLTMQTWVDMKQTDRYAFDLQRGHRIKIIFSRDGEFHPGVSLLGPSYPNPFTTHVTIPVLIDKDHSNAQVEIYDMMGRRLAELSRYFGSAGLHKIEWRPEEREGSIESGILLYRLTVNGVRTPARKMLKVN